LKKLTGTYRLLDDEIYTHYRKYRLPKKIKCRDRRELKTIVKTIFEVIAEHLVEKSHGVILRNFGYLFIWKIPRKTSYNIMTNGGKVKEKFNYKTDNHIYSPVLIPSLPFKGWSMDNTFNKTLKLKLKDKLVAGKKYFTYIHSLKNIINTRKKDEFNK